MRREKEIAKIETAVHERLTKEIDYWQERYLQLKDALAAGRQPRMQPENARRRVEELRARLEVRYKELEARRNLISSSPLVAGAALVVPTGLMARLLKNEASPDTFATDLQRKKAIETIAMHAVLEAERSRGYTTRDVSAEKCGWDISSFKHEAADRHIEVKGRAKGAGTITITRNEILYGLNQQEKFRLAIVLVDENDGIDGPYYIRNPFGQEPDWGVASINYDLSELIASAQPFC